MLHKLSLTHRNQHPAEFSLHKRGCRKGVLQSMFFAPGGPFYSFLPLILLILLPFGCLCCLILPTLLPFSMLQLARVADSVAFFCASAGSCCRFSCFFVAPAISYYRFSGLFVVVQDSYYGFNLLFLPDAVHFFRAYYHMGGAPFLRLCGHQ